MKPNTKITTGIILTILAGVGVNIHGYSTETITNQTITYRHYRKCIDGPYIVSDEGTFPATSAVNTKTLDGLTNGQKINVKFEIPKWEDIFCKRFAGINTN